MAVVTAIKPQKNKKRLNIYLDGKFGFGIGLETLVQLRIKIGQELSEIEVEKIVKQSEFQLTYDKILRFATIRPRSKKEFENWFAKHKVHSSLHQDLFNRLKRLELLDDKKFSAWWIGQRLEFKLKSKRELKQELKGKGVETSIIEDIMSQDNIDEKLMINKLLKKNHRKWLSLSGFEKRKKIFNYLSGKGFDYSSISEVLRDHSED